MEVKVKFLINRMRQKLNIEYMHFLTLTLHTELKGHIHYVYVHIVYISLY